VADKERGASTWKGRQCRIILDHDPVAVRVAGGWFIFEVDARDRPVVFSVSDADLRAVEDDDRGLVEAKGFRTDVRNLEPVK
jgi:hypothetical protein